MEYNEDVINLTQNEYDLLRTIVLEECLDYFDSIDIKSLQEKTELSNAYIGRVLKKLKTFSFVEEGMKKGKAYTYFVTSLGYEYVFNILTNSATKEVEDMKKEISQYKGKEISQYKGDEIKNER